MTCPGKEDVFVVSGGTSSAMVLDIMKALGEPQQTCILYLTDTSDSREGSHRCILLSHAAVLDSGLQSRAILPQQPP